MKIPGYRYVSMVGIVKIEVVTFIFLYIRVYKVTMKSFQATEGNMQRSDWDIRKFL